jgi:hypothetical protein
MSMPERQYQQMIHRYRYEAWAAQQAQEQAEQDAARHAELNTEEASPRGRTRRERRAVAAVRRQHRLGYRSYRTRGDVIMTVHYATLVLAYVGPDSATLQARGFDAVKQYYEQYIGPREERRRQEHKQPSNSATFDTWWQTHKHHPGIWTAQLHYNGSTKTVENTHLDDCDDYYPDVAIGPILEELASQGWRVLHVSEDKQVIHTGTPPNAEAQSIPARIRYLLERS